MEVFTLYNIGRQGARCENWNAQIKRGIKFETEPIHPQYIYIYIYVYSKQDQGMNVKLPNNYRK